MNSSRRTAFARCRKFHQQHPFVLQTDGGEQRRGLRAGGIHQRHCSAAIPTGAGPIWFPVNYLLVEALERYHHFYGDHLQVECPTGSGRMMNLKEVAGELTSRLARHLPSRSRRPERRGRAARALRARSALARA